LKFKDRFKVELQGVEPWSSQANRKLSTCLSFRWFSWFHRPDGLPM